MHGYSRDKKPGCEQLEHGMLATGAGLSIAVRVIPGNTAYPAAFTRIGGEIQELTGVGLLAMVAGPGRTTDARVEDLKKDTDFSWVTALRNTDIQDLAEDYGPLQLSLFDQQNLAEITHPKYPGERLIACRNPALVAKCAHRRTALLEAAEETLEAIKKSADAGGTRGAGRIGVRVGKIVGKYNMAKHFTLAITDARFTFERNAESIMREADLDGIHVIRTSLPGGHGCPEAVRTHKSLANVEKIFKTPETRDLGIRRIRHHTEDRTRAHASPCMLAAHLTWHLRTDWPPDEHPREPARPRGTGRQGPRLGGRGFQGQHPEDR